MQADVVTLIWTSATEEDLRALRDAEGGGVRSRQVDERSLELRIVEGRQQGVVVALATTNDEATRALRAGADAVLRRGECRPDQIAEAIRMAKEAASSRLEKMAAGGPAGDLEPAAFSLLMRALCRQISDSLTSAWSQYESISQHLRDVRELQSKLEEWASLAAPTDEFRRLQGRASLLFSEDVRQMLENVSGSLHRAETVLENAQILSPAKSPAYVDVDLVLEELIELLRGEVTNRADLRLRVTEGCRIGLPVTFLVCLVTTIIAGIVDGFRVASRWDGRIEIRAYTIDGIVVIEIHDNGGPLHEDLDSCVAGSTTRGGQLARVRERIRAAGGELLVESTEAGTVARVYLAGGEADWTATTTPPPRPTLEFARRTRGRPPRPKS